MKKMFKKGLSVILAVLMVMSVIPVSLMSASASAASLGYVVGDTVEFGSYPQSKVTDSALLEELNALTLEWNSYGFRSGSGEFGSMAESDYMKYADVEFGGEKYRAVTFSQYRPNLAYIASTEKNSNQDDNGYFTDSVYWFKFEPIKWSIVDAENGLIMSESLIDAQGYSETVYYYDNGGSTEDNYYLDSSHRTYANDYEDASLREWLNDDFYNTAFTGEEKNKVLTYKADNSATVAKYDSASARDRVFLLSYSDVNNADMGFASDSDRTAEGTDYAKALGLYVPDSGESSFWWLRTPGSYSYYACRVDNSGKTDEYGNTVDFTNYGVRPVIRYDFDGMGERYTATFLVDGEVYSQNSYAVGDEIVQPDEPSKEGYTFSGWDAMIPETMGYEDLSFNALWDANAYTVAFNAGEGTFKDGTAQKTVTADYASAINAPSDVPVLTGYEFAGWNDENGDPVIFPLTVTGDMTLTARFAAGAFTVTFYDGEAVYTVQDYTFDDVITAPEPPSKAGYVFEGWSMLPGGAVSDNLGTVTGNMSFYAVWSAGAAEYKISFYQMNTLGMYPRKADETMTVSAATGVSVFYTPEERDGFSVDSRSTLTATVAADGSTVLKVYYARNQYTLTIDGVENLLYFGASIPAELTRVPEKEGLTHVGFADESGEIVDIPAKMPAEDITFTSVWESAYYTLTFIVDGMYYTYEYAYGDYIEAVETPAKDGYIFVGWETEDGEAADIPETMPATDLTYYAVWEKAAVELVPAEGWEFVIDNENMAITGVLLGTTENDLQGGLEVIGDGYIEITLTEKGKVGTGAVVSLYDNATGDKLGDYTVVIVSDLDGDGLSTGADAKILEDEILLITNWSYKDIYENGQLVDNPEYNSYLVMASDANEDGIINNVDFYGMGFGTYDINIYTMDTDGSYFPPEQKRGYYGVNNEIVSYTPEPAEEGFYIDTEKSVLEGVITEDTQLQLSVYYAREQYTIIYNIDGYEWATDTYYYGETIVMPEEPVLNGCTFSGWNMEIPETMPAEDITVYGVFTVNTWDVVYLIDGEEYYRISVDYGIDVPVIDSPERAGYTFSGWDKSDFTMPDTDVFINGYWIANDDTPYTLEGYVMDTTGEYVLAYSVTKSGVTGETVEIVPEELEGFYFDAEHSVTSGVIAADGSTVLRFFYARNLHTVSFVDYDGEVYAESDYYYGSILVEPVQPMKENFVFAGWVDPNGNPASFPMLVEGDLTFAATWEKATVKLIPAEDSLTVIDRTGDVWFVYGYDEWGIYDEQGMMIDVQGDGYYEVIPFGGWDYGTGAVINVYDNATGELVETFYSVFLGELTHDFSVDLVDYNYIIDEINGVTSWSDKSSDEYAPYMLKAADLNCDGKISYIDAAKIMVHINYYGVLDQKNPGKFNYTDGYVYYFALEKENPAQEFWSNSGEEPTKEGYVFKGWYDYETGEQIYRDALPERDVFAYAEWEPAADGEYSITLDANGGEFSIGLEVYTITAEFGEYIDFYENPTREGYEFYGWVNENGEGMAIPVQMPEINETWYAVWMPMECAVTFDACGGYFADGESVYTVYANYDDILELPENPTMEGFTFCGWEPYVSEIVEGDATYYATWESIEYMVTYYVDGEYYEGYSVYFGDELDVPADPYKEGFTFAGWSASEGGYAIDLPATMPAMNLEFFAVWEEENAQTLNVVTPEANLASSGANAVSGSGIINLSNASVTLEFTEAYYVGKAVTPSVYLQYGDELFDAKKELSIAYSDNGKVGTARAILEGLNRFSGSAELEFTISYEEIPEQIVNVTALGEIGKILLSWGISSEVGTSRYNIYRRDEGSDEYTLIKTVNGRETLSYTDTAVEEGKTYIYYITGVGTYGAESVPSAEVYATVQSDKEIPTVYKLKPASNSILYATQTLSINAEDNVGIAKAVYSYSEDNGATWTVIGEATGSGFACRFDTTVVKGTSVSVKVVAYDAAGNASDEIINTYKVDNVGPEKVTGLSATVQSSIITLSWDNVADADANYFILQQKVNGEWKTIQTNLKTRGANVENLQAETDYTFRVACVDLRGNVGQYSDEYTVRTDVDTIIPAITGQSPDPSRFRSSFTYTATAQDECGIKSIKVQYSYDEETWTDIETRTFSNVERIQKHSVIINTNDYNEGYIYIRAIATDISGNESVSDGTAPCRGYYIDRTAPEAPTGLKAISQDGYVSLEWTVGTENDLGGYYVYRATEENGEYTAIASNRAVYNYHDQTVERGKVYYYKIRVSDTCGNMSGYSEAVSAKMLDDTVKPVVRSIGETYNNSLSRSYNSFNVVASDNNMLSYMVVEYCTTKDMTYAEAARAESIADAYKNIAVKIPMDGLESGDKVYVRAYAVDVMGLKSDYVNAQYTVDLTAPSATDFKATVVNNKVTLTWNDCGEADLAGFRVYYSANGKDYTSTGARGASSSGTYSFIHYINAQQSGTYYYKLVPLDKLQNASELITSVEYTYIAPPDPDPEEDEPPVIIVNEAPVASFTCKSFMILNVEDEFDASASTDDSQITEYIWDFGDGTSSTEIRPVKKYAAVGTYEVTLTVKDAEGLQHSVTQTVEVKEREKLGTLKVRVVDENGRAVPYAPVYFDLGGKDMKEVAADSSGVATMLLPDGTHKVGAYKEHYLPAKKEIVVLANATRTITLTIVKGEIITGEFEITRMTFDEIVAAGIDPYAPDNRLVYSATVRLTYGTTPVNVTYYRNNDKILSYTVNGEGGTVITPGGGGGGYTRPNSGGSSTGDRKIVSVTYIGSNDKNEDVVAILDIPAQASYLKEFFDVKLHIVNNAASDFVMKDNEIKLNVPDGMTLMTGLNGGYQNSDTVYIDKIRGQNTVTISWCLRGDVAGEYDLTADYTGILAEFEELVTATFKTEEPIKVYGLEGVKFRILAADEIHNDTLYFNVELENERPIDVLLPDISVINSKVLNVTDKVLGVDDTVFTSTAYLLNIYVQLENGKKQYLPISYSPTGNLSANLEVLAPGQKLVHEYVAYNAINYDGVAYFKDAAVIEFEGLLENIEVGSFTKERYSYIDFSEKFNNIYSGTSQDIIDAYLYVNDNTNYYYYCDADLETQRDAVLAEVSEFAVDTLKLEINEKELYGLSVEEERKLIKNELLKILASESINNKVRELEIAYNYNAVGKLIEKVVDSVKQYANLDDVARLSDYLTSQKYYYAVRLKEDGEGACYKKLRKDIELNCPEIKVAIGEISDEDFFDSIIGADANSILGGLIDLGIGAFSAGFSAYIKAREDAYYQSMLRYHCNNVVAKTILNSLVSVTINTGIATNAIIADIASEFLETLCAKEEELKSLNEQFNEHYIKDLGKEIITETTKGLLNNIITIAFGSTIVGVVSVGVYIIKYVVNEVLNIDNEIAQENALIIYARLSDAFSKMFRIRTPGTEIDDFTSMVILMGLCELRLSGESQYKSFMQEYIDGVYPLGPNTEEEVMEKVNAVKSTEYETLDEWYDVVQYNIVSARDTLFNIEFTESNIPSAPSVTLDYDNCQTVQSFGKEYEYCFGDGVWKSCNGKPVEFELKTVPQTLRVRVAASDSNLAGEITTVRIYAQKELSKLITVKYDGGKYIFSNLTSERAYEMTLLNSSLSTPDWSSKAYINDSKATGAESDYIAIRSRLNSELLETDSLPLVLKVQKKQALDLTIKGDGTVEQSNTSGEYFAGDTVDLIATPHESCEFLGWYVDGELVSEDVHYILEYYEGVEVKAEFTGVTVKSIEIETMPAKTVYTVGEALSTEGMTLKVRYSDLSTKIISSGFVCSETVFAKDGETTVTVTYGGETTEFTVNVYKEYYILTFVIEGETAEFEMKFGEAIEFDIDIDRPGYDFTGWTPEMPATMPANDLTLTATFEPKTYDVIFDANGGVFADGTTYITASVDYDAVIAVPTAPEKQGYLFAGWSYNGENFGENLGTMNDVDGMVFTAEWIAATDTVYTVETYVMDTTGEYVLSTQIMNGTTGETVTAEPVVDEGFELNREKSTLSGVIAGDNSLVLSVYIDRLIFTLTVDNGTETLSEDYYYGAIIASVETPSKTGYTFMGWDNEIPATMPAEDVISTAIFEANTYDAVFMNGSEEFATVSVKYGEMISVPEETPEKEGFNFVGWSLDGVIILADLGTMDETGKTFYAVWQAYTPDHEHIPYTVTIDATCTVAGMEYTICMECGETIGEATVLPALNHSKTQTVTVDATCTVAGMQYEICEFCGETIGDAVVRPALGHTAGDWETTKEPACTEKGEQIKKCTVCGVTVETGELEAPGHTAGEWETIKEPTCTEKGEQIKKCTVCGETVETGEIKEKGHTPAKEWTVVLKPTTEKEGKRVIKCLVCGAAVEEDAISKLEVARHEDTDVSIEYQPDDYEGEVSINVEETFDGGAFNIVSTQTGSAKSQIFDITMTVDGKETQPEGKVTVRIPLPEGYNPNRSFVYHVDSKTGKVEKINSRYENGCLVFETDHFSYYAVVDESQAGTAVNATVSIAQPSITTVKYGDTLILHAEISGNIPEGATLEWSVEGEGVTIEPSADGKTCAVTSTAKGEVTVTVKLVDKNGNALSNSEGDEISAQQNLTSKAGFFQKLISFFKNLFGMNRIIAQAFKFVY